MPDLPHLDPVEQRILGSLLEKQKTVPATYPLTLSALRTACNQTSSRDPVVEYDDATLERALRALRERNLVRVVWADTGRRTLKYHQLLDGLLELDDAERAILTVLLLRGPNAPGELKTRTERLHRFTGREQVEECLDGLAARDQPLVLELERKAGQQDRRWAHLLGEPPVDAQVAQAAVDLDSVLADGPETRDAKVRSTYTTVAATYADNLVDELDGLPFERWVVARVAELADGHPIVDAGCGPGHVAAYLASLGADVTGIDLTPAMVEEARARFPDLAFEVGDLRRLLKPRAAEGWGAVLGWYSLIHLAGSELPGAITAMARTLRPGGWLVLGLHAGPEVRHLDTWWDHEVDVDVVLHDPEQVSAVVRAAGLTDLECYVRTPLTHRGETTRRCYLLARTPA